MRTALIDSDGVAQKVLLAAAQDVAVPEGLTAIETDQHVGVGEVWDGSSWSYMPPQPTDDMINEERDARIAAGFVFDGNHYQMNSAAITEAAMIATIAIQNNVQAGDYRWHGGDEDFTWTTSDNVDVFMDAQDMQNLASAMRAHRNKMKDKAKALKAMDPKPTGYNEEQHWT